MKRIRQDFDRFFEEAVPAVIKAEGIFVDFNARKGVRKDILDKTDVRYIPRKRKKVEKRAEQKRTEQICKSAFDFIGMHPDAVDAIKSKIEEFS